MLETLQRWQVPDWVLCIAIKSRNVYESLFDWPLLDWHLSLSERFFHFVDLTVVFMVTLLVLSFIYSFILLPLFNYVKDRYHLNKGYKEYKGGCHCGKISFTCKGPRHLVVWDCNCSICKMKQNKHFVVPKSEFHLSKSSQRFLSTYTFNTNVAQHHFCKVCGICAFYVPRSNPDGIGITFNCISSDQVESVQFNQFDGVRWEDFIAFSGIQKHSKKRD